MVFVGRPPEAELIVHQLWVFSVSYPGSSGSMEINPMRSSDAKQPDDASPNDAISWDTTSSSTKTGFHSLLLILERVRAENIFYSLRLIMNE